MSGLRLRDRVLTPRPGRPLLMGIVNASPDSFSDAVRRDTPGRRLDHAMALVADGADLIDVGGESGVTYTDVTPAEVECGRIVPLVERLVAEGVTVSVDTWKPEVADAALGAGAHLLNDVSGLADPRLGEAAARTGAGLVLMHTRAAPKQEHFADYGGAVTDDVLAVLAALVERAAGLGVAPDRLLLDPGPDFAKTPEETVEVLRALPRLRALGLPVLLAVSNKYFVGAITARAPADRLAGTLGAVAWAADAGAALLRGHDVRAARELLEVKAVLDGHAAVPEVDRADEALKWIRATP